MRTSCSRHRATRAARPIRAFCRGSAARR